MGDIRGAPPFPAFPAVGQTHELDIRVLRVPGTSCSKMIIRHMNARSIPCKMFIALGLATGPLQIMLTICRMYLGRPCTGDYHY